MTEQKSMSARLLEILQHSIGADQYGRIGCYGLTRNHFVAGGLDIEHCRELVRHGFMVEGPASEITGGSPWFRVTDDGFRAVADFSQRPPKVSRSKARYKRYLESSECFDNFRHFLIWETYQRKQRATS